MKEQKETEKISREADMPFEKQLVVDDNLSDIHSQSVSQSGF